MKSRLSKDQWLQQAIEILSREGSGKLRIDAICRELGVSKGSFYWHFKDRNDFLHSIVAYWADHYTERVKREVQKHGGSAKERLAVLLGLVVAEDLAGYDPLFDAWANHELEILPHVREVHRTRHDYVRDLFAEMGFTGEDLALRTQALMGYMKYRSQHSLSWESLGDPGNLETQLEFFTRR